MITKSLKKTFAALLAAIMVVGTMSACGKDEVNEKTKATTNDNAAVTDGTDSIKELSGTLTIWSFTNELRSMATAFMKEYPGVEVEYSMIPMDNGEYQQKVKASLGTKDCPDVIALEGTFLREFVESDFLMDVTDLKPLAEELDTYDFTIQAGSDGDVVKAYSYQATPGAYYYRRSLAKEYFETDDPAEVQALISDMDKFKEAAKIVHDKSNGDTYMISSAGDFTEMFLTNRDQPWIVDNKLTIDPMVNDLFETCKQFRDNDWESQATQWSEGWFAGMKDELKDANGNAKQVFGYFLPTWGLPYVIMPNSGEGDTSTAGDWGCAAGPLGYRNGGTWIAGMEDSKNKDIAKEFVRFCALDEQNLTNWATGVYTHDYLKAIDPTIPDDLKQAAGDFVSSDKVIKKVMSQLDDSDSTKFLGGQNAYTGFAEAAPKVDLKTMQGTDATIGNAMASAITEYAAGTMDFDEAMQLFKDGVATVLPDIEID